MELIFEVLFQFVFEVVGEVLFQAGYHGTARVFRSRVGRIILASAAGLGAGLLWGIRLSEAGRVQVPRALWVSLALCAVFALVALWRWRLGRRPGDDALVAPPWRWAAYRLAGFALLNAAIAVGIGLGFNPQPLR